MREQERMIWCDEVRHDLTAFAHHELMGVRRTRVARHLATCAGCDDVYRQVTLLARELHATTPLIGAETRAFGRMWQSIAAQIVHAPRPRVSAPQLATGTVALTMAIVFALVWAPQGVRMAPPTQPTAVRGADDGTPIAMIFAETDDSIATESRDQDGTATPTPSLQSNYAPTPNATEAS